MMKKLLFMIFSIYLLIGCSSPTPTSTSGDFKHKGINFGPNKDADYRKGVIHACRPIDCGYVKDLKSLKTNESYRKGWEDGLYKCKGKEPGEHM